MRPLLTMLSSGQNHERRQLDEAQAVLVEMPDLLPKRAFLGGWIKRPQAFLAVDHELYSSSCVTIAFPPGSPAPGLRMRCCERGEGGCR